ncbi:MAG TPA: c-type cytochrome domain-containing protein [Chitinophagaceae bacterium]|nr:c-type cytochrome domain-containing protein [Chitinophagaceae bacterium]
MLIVISEFIGRFHVLLVHLPIGFLLIGLLLQWLSSREKHHISKQAIILVYLCGMIAAVASCITGYLLSLNDDYDESILGWHLWMGISVAFVSAVLYIRLRFGKTDLLYKILSFALLILIFITGHLGGSLTHGEDYLTAALSDAEKTDSIPQKKIDNIQEAYAYADVIQPLLQARCYSCHGPRKQKGKLRLDDQQWILKGGKHGPVLSSNYEQSKILKRILLPLDDDDHMPPRQKAQFTDEEIALIHWWIAGGADFSKKVKELNQPDSVKPLLLALQSDHIEKKALPLIPSEPVEQADEKSLQPLKDKDVVIMPVSQSSHYLQVSFVAASDVSDNDIKLLLNAKKQIAWLNANNTNINDSALGVIGQCTNITLLQLNNTKITDAGLKFISGLSKLQSLSLVGTKVTSKGVMQLDSIKTLQSIYLYQTNADRRDWSALQKAFPKASLDSGGYKVPLFNEDTVIVKAPAKKTN